MATSDSLNSSSMRVVKMNFRGGIAHDHMQHTTSVYRVYAILHDHEYCLDSLYRAVARDFTNIAQSLPCGKRVLRTYTRCIGVDATKHVQLPMSS